MDVREVKVRAGKDKTPVVNELAPTWPFRMVVCGASGSGKTNMVLDLIERYIPWNTLSVYARHLQAPSYQALREKIERREKKLGRPISLWEDTLENVVPLDEMNGDNRNLVLFDDFVLDRAHQDVIAEYFVRGRHHNCSVIYVSQSYFDVPKIIRTNCSHAVIFKGWNGHDLIGLYKDHGSGMRKDEFERFLRDATRPKYGFAVIDNTPTLPELRWRIGWDRLVLPDEDSASRAPQGT